MFVALGMLLDVQYLSADREDGTVLRARAVPGGITGYLVGKLVTVSGTVGLYVAVVVAGGALLIDGVDVRTVDWVTFTWVLAARPRRDAVDRPGARRARAEPAQRRVRVAAGRGTHRDLGDLRPGHRARGRVAGGRPGVPGVLARARDARRLPPGRGGRRGDSGGRGARWRPPRCSGRGRWSASSSRPSCCGAWRARSRDRASRRDGTGRCSASVTVPVGEGWQGGRVPDTTRDVSPRRPAPPRRQPRRRVPRRAVRGDRDARRRATAVRSSCSAPGGASRRCTSSRRCCCARAAPARRCWSRRCWPSCATRSPPPSVPGCAPSRSTRPTRTSGTSCCDALGADEVDVLLVSPGAAEQPVVPREAAARARAARSACWWSTRRTASATGATTSARTTGACATSSPTMPAGVPVLATTATANSAWSPTSPSSSAPAASGVLTIRGPLARASLRLGVLRLPDAADPARLAAQPPRRPAGLRHHLHAHGVGRRGHRAAAARGRARRARLHGPDRPRGARGVRGARSRPTR